MFYRLLGRLFWLFVVLPFLTDFLKSVAIAMIDRTLVKNKMEPLKPVNRRAPRPSYARTPSPS